MSLLQPLDDILDALLLVPAECSVQTSMCRVILTLDGFIAWSLVDKVGDWGSVGRYRSE